MMRRHIEIAPVGGRTGFISVRFFSWGAYHFFAEPPQGVPVGLLMDKEGMVRWKKVGFMPTDTVFFKESLREKIEDLLEM